MWRWVLALALVGVLALTARPIAPGVITWPAGACAVDWFQGRALVLSCPGRDMLRLWPLPPVSPWWEDQPAPPGQTARETLHFWDISAKCRNF